MFLLAGLGIWRQTRGNPLCFLYHLGIVLWHQKILWLAQRFCNRQKPIQRAVRAQRSLRGVKAAVDVLVKTRKEFERYTSVKASLEAQITREGKLLYGRKALAGT